ncbi:MAG: hypothetical protein NTU71_05780 [Verrucomicrobia bacterium]|nr:hypothetical protein [Verrucomicrobiota bacterium]
MNRSFPRSLGLLAAVCWGVVAGAVVEPVLTSKAGPWGQLESRTVYLEPPESLLAVVAKPSTVTRWTFEQATAHAVRETLVKAKVPEAVIERLFSPVRFVASGNSIVLQPEVEDLAALSQESRSALYLELAKHAANEYQRDPVFILGGDVDDWMQGASLTPPQQALFRRLLWKRGGATVFSDVQALLGLAKTPDEVNAVFRSVTRVRSLLVELKLPLAGDRKAFIDYWAGGQADSSRSAFIAAITQRRAPQTVDITHFLPSLIRQRVYTFPEMDLGLKGRFPDCHWTSLNFFNATPKDVYLDTKFAAEHLLKDYAVVDAPYQFGDVLCFLDDGEGLHTCVQIADDIVLTKNGDSILAPWTLMLLKDVDAIYRRSPNTRIQGYRLKK